VNGVIFIVGGWYDQGASFAPKFSMFGAGLLVSENIEIGSHDVYHWCF